MIDAATLEVTTIPISVGIEAHIFPWGVAVSPDGKLAYLAVEFGPTGTRGIVAIDTATNTVTGVPSGVSVIDATAIAAGGPVLALDPGVAVSPDGTKVYLANGGVAVTPDGRRVYVVQGSNNVSVIDAATDTVVATVPVGNSPVGVAVTPDGRKVFVTNSGSNTVSVINTAKDKVIATIPVGKGPTSFGVFIQPAGRFAGTPGHSNCHGQSVSALAQQFGGLNGAAAALGYSSVSALQNAIMAFCED